MTGARLLYCQPTFHNPTGAGHRFFPAEPAGACLRLSFAAAADPAELVEGVRLLRSGNAP
ncbi:hypothetical protein ACFYUK_21615 [Nonomuraea wenchangensis]